MTDQQIKTAVRQYRGSDPEHRQSLLSRLQSLASNCPQRETREQAIALLPYLVEAENALQADVERVVWMTDSDLALAVRQAMEAAGRYAFAPLPFYQPGRSVRLTGDGPSSWTDWIVVARTKAQLKWGTLPGGYVAGRLVRTPARGRRTDPAATEVPRGGPVGERGAPSRTGQLPHDWQRWPAGLRRLDRALAGR
jgi:hypothetical protein